VFKQGSIILALLIGCCSAAVVQGKGLPSPVDDEKTTVTVYFATEHVPEGLKAGAKMHLLSVNGKTVIPSGKVSYSTSVVVPEVEVASVTPVEKPKDPEQAVKVELSVTKDQAAKIERFKAMLVTRVERKAGGGGAETKKKPITFRLMPIKEEKQ
jgi:hypothetical protein